MPRTILDFRITGVKTATKEGLGPIDMTKGKETQQGDHIQIITRKTSLKIEVVPIQLVPSVESFTKVHVDWETTLCYTSGKEGHYSKNCPKNT